MRNSFMLLALLIALLTTTTARAQDMLGCVSYDDQNNTDSSTAGFKTNSTGEQLQTATYTTGLMIDPDLVVTQSEVGAGVNYNIQT